MAPVSFLTELNRPSKRSEDFVKNTKSKTVEMILVTVVYCLLLPLSYSKVEADQQCSAQESSASRYSRDAQSNGNERTTNAITYAKGFYYADLNLEKTNLKTIAEYVKRIVFPFSINIPGTMTILTIHNLNITDECNYNGNETMCDICYERVQISTKPSRMNYSNATTCDSSHLEMDKIGFYPENVTSLTQKVTAKGSFEINETCMNKFPCNSLVLSVNWTTMLASSYSNLTGFECVKTHSVNESRVDYNLTLNGEIKSERFMRNVRDAANLINQIIPLDFKSFKVKTTGLVKMKISPNVWYNKPLTITCTIEDNVETVYWIIQGNEDNEEAIISDRHYKFTNGIESTSRLHINATSIWKGYYCCRFLFANGALTHEACGDSTIYLLPEEITPFQAGYTLMKPGLKLEEEVKCCIKNDGEKYEVIWKDGSLGRVSNTSVLTGNGTKCSKLKINKIFNNSINYTCTFVNPKRQNTSGAIVITVLSENDTSCEKEQYRGHAWIITKASQYAESTKPCEDQKVGKIIRFCKKDGNWDEVFFNCTSKKLVTLLSLAKELKEGRGSTSEKLPEVLRNLTNINIKSSDTADAIALSYILDTLTYAAEYSQSTFNSTVISDFLSIASNVTRQRKDATENVEFDSSILMRAVESFSDFFTPPEKEFSVLFANIELKGKEFDAEPEDSYFQRFSENYTAEIDINILKESMKNNSFKISTILYLNIDDILPQNTESEGLPKDYFINSRVQATTLKVNTSEKKTDINLSIKMFFPPKQANGDLKTARCVFWDYHKGGWSLVGCKTKVSVNGTYCICNHLTPFSVLMSRSERLIPFLDEITYIGMVISIGSLVLFITVEIVVWNAVVKTSVTHFRHTTLINTAIALLFAQCFFLIGAIHSVKNNETLCTIATIFCHFFFLSVFFWTLTQSLTLLYRLLFVFHQMTKSIFMSFSFFVGYVCPLAIVIATTTTFISKGKYKKEKVCWLNAKPSGEFTAFYTFIIPVGCIIGINMLILAVVIMKLMRPSVSEGIRNKEDKETITKIVKAILILTPTFGLTWIVGFSLTEDSHDFEHYAFVLLNSIQGLFILITTGVTEIKVREAFINRVKLMIYQSTPENVYTKTSSHSVGK
ncbi:adhesion G-protein coupled receptor F3 [Scyliorhinus torazame]|uniref:adhesion G-protein coupled receptor F3 n=1 Tax=Scyliorhinus torazame TaxID=75743 RepID=UPI003B5B5998